MTKEQRAEMMRRYETIGLTLGYMYDQERTSPVIAQKIYELEQECAELEEMLFGDADGL